MKNKIVALGLGCSISAFLNAGELRYSCNFQDPSGDFDYGSIMNFAEQSSVAPASFGFFARDGYIMVASPDISVKKDNKQIIVSGIFSNHPYYKSFIATFPLPCTDAGTISASIKLTDKTGRALLRPLYECEVEQAQ